VVIGSLKMRIQSLKTRLLVIHHACCTSSNGF
jgi:hypothetical protein